MDVSVAVVPGLAGAARGVLEASADAVHNGDCAALAVVVATEGSTYVRAGAMALFAQDAGQVGWLSGGCLEPEIARHARECASSARLGWLEIDTREDEALLSGSAVGCRGRLRLALLPLSALTGWDEIVRTWRDEGRPLQLSIDVHGAVAAIAGARRSAWSMPVHAEEAVEDGRWELTIAPPPAVLVFGAGPETPVLVPLLRQLGWVVVVVERRPRWAHGAGIADAHLALAPAQALRGLGRPFDAALVMHHDFELDREGLAALADGPIGFIGLLGPGRRREDLFRVLPPALRDALKSRLHSPVGLDLGGQGPEAIALSIAAQLHVQRPAP